MANGGTMRAVVFKGPGKVVLEERPIPTVQAPTDIIVKVTKVLGPTVRLSHLR